MLTAVDSSWRWPDRVALEVDIDGDGRFEDDRVSCEGEPVGDSQLEAPSSCLRAVIEGDRIPPGRVRAWLGADAPGQFALNVSGRIERGPQATADDPARLEFAAHPGSTGEIAALLLGDLAADDSMIIGVWERWHIWLWVGSGGEAARADEDDEEGDENADEGETGDEGESDEEPTGQGDGEGGDSTSAEAAPSEAQREGTHADAAPATDAALLDEMAGVSFLGDDDLGIDGLFDESPLVASTAEPLGATTSSSSSLAAEAPAWQPASSSSSPWTPISADEWSPLPDAMDAFLADSVVASWELDRGLRLSPFPQPLPQYDVSHSTAPVAVVPQVLASAAPTASAAESTSEAESWGGAPVLFSTGLVPEPGTAVLLACGLAGLAARRLR